MYSVSHLPQLDEYGARIASLHYEPLCVTVSTDTPVSSNDPVALDGVIAFAAVTDALKGRPFPQVGGPFWQPLPLKLDRVIDGLPLWTSTDFLPSDLHTRLTHIHRRTADNPYAMSGLISTLNRNRPRRFPLSTAGPYMDYRVPEKRFMARQWTAWCIGNGAEIERLLALVQYFGKGSKRGCGFVTEWTVRPAERFAWRDERGFALRPIPLDDPFAPGVRQGWTPPYWHRDTWRLCEPSSVLSLL